MNLNMTKKRRKAAKRYRALQSDTEQTNDVTVLAPLIHRTDCKFQYYLF